MIGCPHCGKPVDIPPQDHPLCWHKIVATLRAEVRQLKESLREVRVGPGYPRPIRDTEGEG